MYAFSGRSHACRVTFDQIIVPTFATANATCFLLSVMKKDVLGQEIAPLTILKVLINDYEENAHVINEGQAYVEGRKSELFP